MNPETMLDTVGKGCEAATKFQEIIQKVFGPGWTKKQADADAYADERKLQTIRNNPDMEIVYTKDGMSARARTPEALAARAEQRLLGDSVREQENLEKIFDIAADDIKQITDGSDKTVDDDWLVRFKNISKDISSEEMQYIWGKILANEVEKPGSFSVRTLETIRNISRAEAAVFQKIIPFVIQLSNDYFITSDEEIKKKYGINYVDVMVLDECNLVELSEVSYNPKMKQGDRRNLITDERLAIINGIAETAVKVSFSAYKLTTAGKELYQILAHSPNNDYFMDVIEHIFKENMSNINVTVHEVVENKHENTTYKINALRVFKNS